MKEKVVSPFETPLSLNPDGRGKEMRASGCSPCADQSSMRRMLLQVLQGGSLQEGQGIEGRAGLGSAPEMLPLGGEVVPAGGSGRRVSKALDVEKTATRRRGVLGVGSAREGGG